MLRYHYYQIFKYSILLYILLVSVSIANPINYIGCFKDRGDPFGTQNRVLDGLMVSKGDMTVEKCINLCKSKSFKYAGVEYSTQCFCGNSYGKYGKSNNCDMKCSGDSNKICGGFWAINIYSTKDIKQSNSNFNKIFNNTNIKNGIDISNNNKSLNNYPKYRDTRYKNHISKTIKPNKPKIKINLYKKINNDSTLDSFYVTNHFQNSQNKIYAIISFKNLQLGSYFSIEWIDYFDGVYSNKILYTYKGTIKSGSGTIKATLINIQKRWPDGVFKVLFRLNGKIIAKKKFIIGNVENIRNLKYNNINIQLDNNLKNTLLNNLKGWILESLRGRTIKPLYDNTIDTLRDTFDWDRVKEELEKISNLDLNTIFSQEPKNFLAKKDKNGIVIISSIYNLSRNMDILIKGEFYRKAGRWLLIAFRLKMIKKEEENRYENL